ncbi:hypothetical protein [Anaerobacillus alkalidiazotrophicus]|nr:hypothetical protein [Anaerobacillus alkalidiazotrophicus]
MKNTFRWDVFFCVFGNRIFALSGAASAFASIAPMKASSMQSSM